MQDMQVSLSRESLNEMINQRNSVKTLAEFYQGAHYLVPGLFHSTLDRIVCGDLQDQLDLASQAVYMKRPKQRCSSIQDKPSPLQTIKLFFSSFQKQLELRIQLSLFMIRLSLGLTNF